MIESDNQYYLHKYKNAPPHPSYIAGIIDGDGCVFIRKIKNGYQSGISITQCRTNILQVIRYHFGGSITSTANRNNKIDQVPFHGIYNKHVVRNQYNLLVRSNEYIVLLEYIKRNIVIKHTQIECLDKLFKYVNVKGVDDKKDELCNMCCHVNKHKINTTYCERINIEYIAGLFDAEGCFYIQTNLKKWYISITQKNYPNVLVYISTFLGFGTIDCEQKYKIYNRVDCLKFISMIKEHLIVKYVQANAFETFLLSTDNDIKQSMYIICNEQKHQIEKFDNLNQNNIGKDGYMETIRVRSLKKQVCKEIHLKRVYKQRSENMKGVNNHNFGKTFSQETKTKMSTSIRDAKGGVSDDTILHVRQLLSEGNTIYNIQQLLDLPRHTISRIKNIDLVCRNEQKDKKTKTKIEQNILKRKISKDDIITVIEKHALHWKPKQILDFINESNAKRSSLDITIDIIKNIKRQIINGKHVIYESEVSSEEYTYYLNLIHQLTASINVPSTDALPTGKAIL